MITEKEVREYVAKLIVPENQEEYLNDRPIPILDGRTWREVFAAADQAAMTKGFDYLHDTFGDFDD